MPNKTEKASRNTKFILLIVGRSGSGKTSLVETLCKDNKGYSAVQSYTTRPARYEGEAGHIFVDDEHFPPKSEWVGYTEFNGYRYCGTKQQIDDADMWVVDPAGITYFMSRYTGPKVPIVVGIHSNPADLKMRMWSRGDKLQDVERRLENDDKAFAHTTAHLWLHNGSTLDFDMALYQLQKLLSDEDWAWKVASRPMHPYPKTAFISGKVTGDDDYIQKFRLCEKECLRKGIVALHPALLPERGFTYEQYMTMCRAMIDCCDSMIMCPDWRDSSGAKVEHEYAQNQLMPIYYYSEHYIFQ